MVGTLGNQPGVSSVSRQSYNERSNWLAFTTLGTAMSLPQQAFADDVAAESPAPVKISSVKVNKTKFTYTGKVIKPKYTVKAANGTMVANKVTGSNGNVVIKPSKTIKKVGTYKVKVTGTGAYTGTKTVTVKVYPKKPSAKTPSATTSAVTAKWSRGTNDVSGYQIKCSKNKSMKGAKTVTAGKNATSKKISGLKASTRYYVQLRAYKVVDGKKYYSDWSAKKSVKTKAKAKKSSGSATVKVYFPGYEKGGVSKTISVSPLATPALKGVKNAKGKKAVVTWKKVSGAAGYQVWYSPSKKFKGAKKATVKKGKTVKKTLTKLKKGTTYYVKVRAYKKVGKKTYYSAWSTVKSVKVKK